MTLKSFRKIDRRNNLFGLYKYQVHPKRLRNGDYWAVRNWCEQRWGPDQSWQTSGVFTYQVSNPRWRVVYPGGRKTPIIYLHGDGEATIFGLFWA